MRLENVRTENDIDRCLAFESEGLINVGEVHCQQRAIAWLNDRERKHSVGKMKNIQLRGTRSTSLHVQLVNGKSEASRQRQANYRASGSSVDENSNGMAIQRTLCVEVSDAAAREGNLPEPSLGEKFG